MWQRRLAGGLELGVVTWILRSYSPAYKPIWANEMVSYAVAVKIRLRRLMTNGKHGPN